MQIFIKDDFVFVTHTDDQIIPDYMYPDMVRQIIPDDTVLTRDSRGRLLPPPATEESRRFILTQQIDAIAAEKLAAGYQRNFGGSVGYQRLAYATEADVRYWLRMQGQVLRLVMRGEDDTLVTFRNTSGDSFEIRAETADAAMVGLEEWAAAISDHAFELKDQLATSTTVDVNYGWPE